MVSSAQNSSRVHWCRRRVRFNKVPGSEKVPKVGRLWCRGKSCSTRFRRRLRGRSGSFGAEPGHDQQGSGEGSGEGLGDFG